MSHSNSRVLTGLIIVSVVSGARGQNNHMRFEHLSLQQGLSQTTVSCIIQDSEGYMWFGTTDGLNKYDGYSFTTYRNDPLNPGSLSDDWVTAICETPARGDRPATLWLGTSLGTLNRYDRHSNRFVHYDLGTNASASSSSDHALLSAAPFMFSFYVNSTITAICEDPRSEGRTLWIGTWGNGLYKLVFPASSGNAPGSEPEAVQITRYQHHPTDSGSLSSNSVYALCLDQFGLLWVATFGGGINVFNEETGKFVRFRHDPEISNSLSDDRVLSIHESRGEGSEASGRGTLWIGTSGGGLDKLVYSPLAGSEHSRPASAAESVRVDPERVDFTHYRHDPSEAYSLSDDDVTKILTDSHGRLWVGTFGGGLNQFDPVTGSFVHYLSDPYDAGSLADDDILTLFEDQGGIIWIGTHLGAGLCKMICTREKFSHYKHVAQNTNGLNDDIIYAIHEERGSGGNTFWIGTYRGGLNKFVRSRDPSGQRGASLRKEPVEFSQYRHDPADPHSLSQDHVRAICQDDAGNLWVGTFSEGLNKFDRDAGTFTRYKHDPADPNSLSDNRIRSLLVDRSGALWIATFGGGVNKREQGSDGFVHFRHDPSDSRSLSDDRAYCLYEDRAGTLWIGTFGGLNKLVVKPTPARGSTDHTEEATNGRHQTETHFVRYRHDPADSRSLPSDQILSIYEDRRGTLWVGTKSGGLCKFDRNSETFTAFTEKDGLASNVIYGILEDDRGNLWLSTNNGLSRFDPHEGSFTNFDEYDGVQSKEFSGGAYCKSSKGEMFFGGVNGFNCFFPDNIKTNAHVPPIVITAFKKFDQVVETCGNEIELSYQDTFISFEFAALDYVQPAKNQYAYKLEGFDREWVYCGPRRFASYTNLSPGEYTFRVRGSNNDGLWNETGVSVTLTIHPPFWKTWWFLVLAAGAVALAAFSWHSYRVRYKIRQLLAIERVRRAENERLRKQVARDFHDEVGHKLTNISLFTEILKRNLNGVSPQATEYLNKIADTSKSLSIGIRDFIWTLDPYKDSLHDVAIRLKDFGDELFDRTAIAFHVQGLGEELETVTLSMHLRRYLVLIFKEAMTEISKNKRCVTVTLEFEIARGQMVISLLCIGMKRDHCEFLTKLSSRSTRTPAKYIDGQVHVFAIDEERTKIQFRGQIPRMGD